MIIEYIYIDTNIFISQNFLEGPYIKKLLEFGKDNYIRIILPKTTINEIKNQFRIKVDEAFKAYKHYMKSSHARYLRNVDFGKQVNNYEYQKLKIDDFCKEFNDEIDNKLEEANVIILPYLHVNSENILEAYFNSQPPFSAKKEKKLGFPDAFIIENLKNWMNENQFELTIMSGDSDFSHLESYSQLITIKKDIKEAYNNLVNLIKLFEKKLTEERIEVLNLIYNSNSEAIIKDLKEYFKDGVLDDESFYNAYTSENVYDIYNLKFTEIDNHGYNVKKILDNEEIQIEILVDMHFSIDVLTDDLDSWVYDSEDKVVYYRDKGIISFEGKIELVFEGNVYVKSKDDYEEIIDYDIDFDSYKVSVYDPNNYY